MSVISSRMAVMAGLVASVLVVSVPAAHAAVPNDPQAPSQQPLKIMEVFEAIDVVAASGRPLGDVIVAPLDTGIDLQHPDLAPRLFSLPAPTPAPDAGTYGGNPPLVPAGSPGWDMIGTLDPPNEQPDSNPDDPTNRSGHGTAVAGVLGAAWNNGIGGAGVAPNARLIALRTCWDNDQCYGHIQPHAVSWAAARGARVMSFSWLGGNNPGLVNAMGAASNTLFVTIPSGNGGAENVDPQNPQPCSANLPNILCVSTSSPTNGLDCGGYGAQTVDVAVPTRNSVTTVNGGGFGPTGCATSYAAPAAAGIATILFGAFPQATPAQVRKAIIDGATPAAAWQGKSVSGGVANATGALYALAGIPRPRGDLEVDLAAAAKQTAKRLRATVLCTTACDATASAAGRVGGRKVRSRTVSTRLEADEAKVIRLRFSRRVLRRIAGENGRVTIKVSVKQGGELERDAVKVKLR